VPDPFFIAEPAVIAFSGGRTSGMMLHHVLRAHNAVLPDDVHVVFCNTGKEHDATLDFVRACGAHWNVPIRWIEYVDADEPKDRWQEVNHATAARNGEPFEAVIRRKNFLPNPVTRFCTTEMKIHATHRFARRALGFDVGYTKAVGLRFDEAHRVSRARGREESGKDGWDLAFPLYDAGLMVRDVTAFWTAQPFDLGLPNQNGTTPMGNCDLCFLKGAGKIASIIAAEPERAAWWARMETIVGQGTTTGTFRTDRPSYAAMLSQGNLALADDSPDTIDCACTD